MNGVTNVIQPQPKTQERANSNNVPGARGSGTPVSGTVGIVGRCAFGGNNGGSTAGGNSNPGSVTRQPAQ